MNSGSLWWRKPRKSRAEGHRLHSDTVGHQATIPGTVFSREHDRFLDGRVLTEHGFDFSQLDAVTADLHLLSMRPRNSMLPSGK